ncbi:hypothetical protein [Mycolicibacterium fortuitum]|uniref:hypothetical protein n=1 Tax=Mycolicibacterium fortuitum TaxID=1766 RepID=UPI000AB71D2F|nr:hypothetical protein [Mycolicibacterium fortuitum]
MELFASWPGNRPAKVEPGNLVLECEICTAAVTKGRGFLTLRGRKLVIYHDYCAQNNRVICGSFPGAEGSDCNRPWKINAGAIGTPDRLLSALAYLAPELKTVDWLQFVQRVVADTEWYFDELGMNGGRRKVGELLEENQEKYASAGFTSQLNMKGGER